MAEQSVLSHNLFSVRVMFEYRKLLHFGPLQIGKFAELVDIERR